MRSSRSSIGLALAAAVLLLAAATYALATENNGRICGLTRQEMSECGPSVAASPAIPPPPTAACCEALDHADLACLCTFKNNKYLSVLGINATRAMQLPTKCDPTRVANC